MIGRAACGIMPVIDRSLAVIDVSRQNGSLFACIYLQHDFAIRLAHVLEDPLPVLLLRSAVSLLINGGRYLLSFNFKCINITIDTGTKGGF